MQSPELPGVATQGIYSAGFYGCIQKREIRLLRWGSVLLVLCDAIGGGETGGVLASTALLARRRRAQSAAKVLLSMCVVVITNGLVDCFAEH
eukprot:9270344-Pyramimonas_sp.AAC.1